MIPPVVDSTWWHEHAGRDDVVLADVRWYLDGRSGRDAYGTGHLPGAVFVDLDRCLSGGADPARGRHPLPEPAVFAAELGALGIGDDDTVVAYDDAGGVIAARLVWMLRVLGRPAALLDGGLRAWTGPLEREPVVRPARRRTALPWPPDALASVDDALDRGSVVLDARDAGRYRGDADPVDPRPGHVPGALSLPCRENLDASGRFLPREELRERFAAVGADGSAPVVAYCGSGVTACHELLALEHAGLGTGRLYPGSWSHYSRTDLPVATGPQPG